MIEFMEFMNKIGPYCLLSIPIISGVIVIINILIYDHYDSLRRKENFSKFIKELEDKINETRVW